MAEKGVIIHVMGMDSTKYGGIEKFNVELARQLTELGYHSIFIYERYPDVQRYVEDITRTDSEIIVSDSRKHPVLFCAKLIKLIISNDVGLVHAHFTKARFYAVPIAHLLGISKIYYTLHSTLGLKKSFHLHTRLWYRIVNRYSRILTVSEHIKSDCIKNWGDSADVSCLYLGVHQIVGDKYVCREELGISDSDTVVLTIANFNHIKGLDVLCEAVKVFVDRFGIENSPKFYIVGQTEKDLNDLQMLIMKLGLEERIVMRGISNEISKYVMAADYYVQPSRQEGISLSLMEASSAGLPIVASNVGGIPEVVKDGENGLLFQSCDADDLACKLYELILDKEKANRFGINGKKRYDSLFSIIPNVTRLIQTYGLS